MDGEEPLWEALNLVNDAIITYRNYLLFCADPIKIVGLFLIKISV